MATFKQTKLSSVLHWIPGIKRIKPVDINRYTVHSSSKYPFYGQQTINNGVVDYLSLNECFLNNKECQVFLLIASNNHSISIVTTPFYLKEDHAATSIIGHEKMTIQSALYIRGSIQKVFENSFDYNAKALQGILQDTIVTLPFLDEKSEELDWEYMENYIDKIKEIQISRIKKFIAEKGYDFRKDINISEDDIAVLNRHNEVAFSSFRLAELFDHIRRGKRIRSMDRIPGKLPFYTAGTDKMGFSDYIGNEEAEVFLQNSLTIDMFGNVYYHGSSFGADDHVTVLYNKCQVYDKKVLQYMQTQISHVIRGKYSYARNFYASDAYDVTIKLPIDRSGQIDFSFMEQYIGVIEKKIVGKVLQAAIRT